ncbi:4-aminobutyrate--2-oxoglutarate transaminase [Paracoccus aminophilus]|uniref:4-aminobutyrate aminotransferase n=1 Tax=Paracoccus aminophilus JCM 7686 TaxID=1367847 RepID=S5YE49_PARAH|nr:4-aminobutyrate--2-oxoglutarate transaminase [Paracoccus aminophilus]AGT09763.1 4-aminobutyrate aminotransferase [Paracoccus aminophilus JCM 7686]
MPSISELVARRNAAVAKGVSTRQIYIARAENAEIWDVEGKRYIDFAAGIAVLNTGHRHPKVMAAVAAQAQDFTHSCFHVSPYESYLALAERLNALTPGDFAKKTMLATTGVEAVENAIKMARAYTGRSGVIAFSGAFHGRTLLGMALTGKVSYKKGFGAMPAEIFHAPFPNPLHGVSEAQARAALDTLLVSDLDPERVAAIIIEPVQGEGGFNIAPPSFLAHLRALCDRFGIVLIADEVQAGLGRTGRMFGFDHAGVVPDLVTMAKGLAGGFPLSAVTGRTEIVDAAPVGGLGGTYAGHPLAVAAAGAVLDVLEDEDLLARATRLGARIRSRLEGFAQDCDAILEVRGLGLMNAVEFGRVGSEGAEDPALVAAIIAEAERRGLILLACGTRNTVIRLLPPLTIPEDLLEEGLALFEESIIAALAAKAAA